MFELSVAIRFLTEGKVQTVLILIGISIGVAVQIFLSALIGGLQKDLINKTVGTSPHITAVSREQQQVSLLADSTPSIIRNAGGDIRAQQPIRSWQPVVKQLRASGLFSAVSVVAEGAAFAYRGEKSQPILIRGVMMNDADILYRITPRLVAGSELSTSNRVLIGSGLAEDLRLDIGETLRLTTAAGSVDNVTVGGIFDLESKQVNDTWVFMPLQRAQALTGLEGGISRIELQIPEVFNAQTVADRFSNSFPSLEWISWQQSNASLLAALRSQSGSSAMIQVLVLLAVTLGISSVLAVSAIQKARQIGILKAIGATKRMIGIIFIAMGALLGFTGAVIGCLLGYLLITGFLAGTADAAGKPLFALSIEPSLYLLSITIATIAGTFAASLPARRSAHLSPVEVIRNG